MIRSAQLPVWEVSVDLVVRVSPTMLQEVLLVADHNDELLTRAKDRPWRCYV